MNSDVIESAEVALEGVTEGPWDVVSGAWGNVWHFPEEGTPKVIVRMGQMREADAEFIAAARALVPDLLAELKVTRELCDTIEKANHQTNEAFTKVALERNKLREELKAARAENERLRRERRFSQLLMLSYYRKLSDDQISEIDALYHEFVIGIPK